MMDNDDFVIVNANDDSNSSDDEKELITPKDLESIRAWLMPTEFDSDGSEYQKHTLAHTPNTGDWLFQTDPYKKWHDDSDGVLWIQGKPGSGKSVVSANLINCLKKEDCPVLFFFSRRIIKSNSEPKHLVRDCLYQFLDYSIALQARLKKLKQQNRDIDDVQFAELWRILVSAILTVPKVYLVFDALDELSVETENFLQQLLELGQRKSKAVRLLITSRPLPYIQDTLLDPSIDILRLAGRNVEQDISLYIDHRISAAACRSLTEDDRSAVKHILCQKGQGLFLYAKLMLDEILRSTVQVHDLLQNLPNSLEEMYVDLLNEHSIRSGASLKFQSALLSWITHASRPLRVTELAALVNSQEDRADLKANQDAKHMIRVSCGPLLEILENQTVQVIHHSFTEFLLHADRSSSEVNNDGKNWFPAFNPSHVHRSLALACVNYLLSGCLDSWEIDSGDNYHYEMPSLMSEGARRLMIQFHLLRYASENLLFHASKFDTLDSIVLLKYQTFFRYKDHVFESWKDFISSSKSDNTKPDNFRPIHLAAQAGLTSYVAYLLEAGEAPDQMDSNKRTPAIHACMNGHASTLGVMLKHGGCPTVADVDGLTPIHHAAKGNHVQVIRCLLDAGVDPSTKKAQEDKDYYSWAPPTIGKTPIQYACELGNERAVVELLDILDASEKSKILPHFAARAGHSKIITCLLKCPEILANINEKDSQNNTALYLAARVRDSSSIRVLLDHGADIHAKSEDLTASPDDSNDFRPANGKSGGHTALQGWAYPVHYSGYHVENAEEWEKVGALLLEAGSDTEVVNDAGETVLFAWVDQFVHNHKDRPDKFVSLMLKFGANTRATSLDGSTILHKISSRNTNDKAFKMLIEAGADINHVRSRDLVTPLIAAAQFQCVGIIGTFAQNGVLPDLQDIDGNTALHRISKSWLFELEDMKEWLKVSDPSIKNHKGETCLYNLRWGNGGQGRVDAIQLLVERGLDLESRNHKGRTALLAACASGEKNFVAGLLKYGANPKAKDYQGKSCLHMVARSQMSNYDHGPIDFKETVDVMRSLINAGADINETDFFGNTPFHDAAELSSQFKTNLDSILELGGLADVVNSKGQTSLHKVTAMREKTPYQWERRDISKRIEYLLSPKLGIHVNAQDNEGMMAIHYAAAVSESSVRMLIGKGAVFTARSNNGKTCLHYADENGQSNIVGYLCKLYKLKGRSVDEKDHLWRTPLHYAASSGRSEAVYHILKSGADATSRDRNGLTPLHLAAEYRSDPNLRKERRDQVLPHWSDVSPGLSKLHPYMDMAQLRKENQCASSAISHDDEACMIEDIIRLLLEAGAEVSATNNFGQTAYEAALIHENENMVVELHSQQSDLKNPVADQWNLFRTKNIGHMLHDVDVARTDHYSLMQAAVNFRNEALLDKLLRAGVDPMAAGPEGLSIVHTIAHFGLVALMRVVAKHIGDLNVFTPPLLHVAASRELSNIQMVELLIALGADVNAMYEEYDKNPRSTGAVIPSYAAGHILAMGEQWWNIDALDILCNAGANLEALDADGNSVLQCALNGAKSGSWGPGVWREETLEVLLKQNVNINMVSPKNGLTPLMAALQADRSSDVIRKIIDCGANITLGKMPAIFAAIETEDTEVVKVLLDAGADLNALYYPEKREKWGYGPTVKTPLLAAAFKDGLPMKKRGEITKREQVIELLLQRGADPLAELPEQNMTVLHGIAGFHGLLEPIIKTGVNLEIRDSQGRTPLLVACSRMANSSYHVTEDESVPRALINAGANIHAVDNDGSTALHLACQAPLLETVKLLISKEASLSVKNNEGFPPLYYALAHEYLVDKIRMVVALTDAGAEAFISGPKGETALHLLAPLFMKLSPVTCKGTSEMYKQHRLDPEKRYFDDAQDLYKHFLAAGVSPSARDAAGNTPLFPYVKTNKGRCDYYIISPPAEEDIRAMLDSHDVLAVNNDGDTLLHAVAAREDRDEEVKKDGLWLFEELMRRGLDPRRENGAGMSALDVAAACGRSDILELFARDD